ncbi:MAG: YihY/virulence factor BrkB family protein [Chitinophagaceae bacterium]|nr:YihY/virulence factor BrkB family protein [Chitinophagaceae bacterium]
MHQRWVALRLTILLFIIFIASILSLIMQGAVLRWLGVKNATVIAVVHNFRWVVILLLFFFAISLIYRYAPAVQKRWKFINPGSLLATFLMIAFTALFSIYVSNFSNYNELYGSISTLLIMMLLVYFNSLVLLIGFELNVSINSLKHEVDERNKLLAGGAHSA